MELVWGFPHGKPETARARRRQRPRQPHPRRVKPHADAPVNVARVRSLPPTRETHSNPAPVALQRMRGAARAPAAELCARNLTRKVGRNREHQHDHHQHKAECTTPPALQRWKRRKEPHTCSHLVTATALIENVLCVKNPLVSPVAPRRGPSARAINDLDQHHSPRSLTGSAAYTPLAFESLLCLTCETIKNTATSVHQVEQLREEINPPSLNDADRRTAPLLTLLFSTLNCSFYESSVSCWLIANQPEQYADGDAI
ncbi:hypothetical protein EYF80_018128 [Liparis tanakae]|uniref:Uncharacterized protein n=1 Tax=Liparis tanakae TaxID=230148 RepID=A0A4Z2I2Y9_9TELE|nr:hypothetical protein EYF80_018128 [Liparis tanakae]